MSPIAIGFTSLAGLLILIALRAPIAVALAAASFFGIWALRDLNIAFALVQDIPFEFAASWSLTAIPMFLLMGAVAHKSGISTSLFRAARLWLSGLPGGLAIAANFACAGFAAASGSSIAAAAAMGRIAVPEMVRAGYDKGLATGVVAAGGTLAALIPPSILFVLYGIFAEVSITKLLIAGILPGLLTALVYCLMIVIRCIADPSLAPKVELSPAERAERWRSLVEVWPIVFLILGIIGGLYGGIVTPTEAGAIGAALSFGIAAMRGRLTWAVFRESVSESAGATGRIFFIAIGAVLLTKFLALAGMSEYVAEVIGSWALDPLLLVIAASIIYLVLGMFLDPLGILLLTLPLLLPMFRALDLDLIWFGVLVVKYIEIGLMTPPVGLNVYVIKGVVDNDITLETIFRGVTWFLAAEVVIMFLLIAFPQISTWLPAQMD